MARKFHEDSGSSQSYSAPRYIGLSEYISTYYPDILESIEESNVPMVVFWSDLFERSKQSEFQDLKKNGVSWPYADRLARLARSYKAADAMLKDLIQQAREVDIYWRGDEFSMFDRIVTETILFRRLEPHEKENYKKRAWDVAMSLGQRHESAFGR